MVIIFRSSLDRKGVAVRTAVVALMFIVVIAAIGVIAWLLLRPEGVVPESIKIGCPISLTGEVALEGQRLSLILKALVEKINEEEGGVYIREYDRKIPLELVILDCQSDSSRTVEITTKLCTEYGVVALTLNHPPTLSFPAAGVAETYGVPFVAGNPLEVCIAEGQKRPKYWEYSWWEFFNVSHVIQGFRAILKSIRDKTNGVVGMFYPDDTDGRYWHDIMIPVFEELGYKYVFPGFFPPDTKDFTATIQKFIENKVEIIHANCFAYQLAPFIRQCAAMGFKPKFVFGGKWANMASELELIGGNLGSGFVHMATWHWKYPYPYSKWINEVWPRLTDMDMSFIMGYIVNHLLVIKAAIEKAGTLNREAINQAIPNVEILGPIGTVKFDPKTHTAYGVTVIVQWIKLPDGRWDAPIIWAPEGTGIPTEELVFPIPWP